MADGSLLQATLRRVPELVNASWYRKLQPLTALVLKDALHSGSYSVADLMKTGQHILGRRHVHPSVAGTLTQLQIAGTFETGTRPITVEEPISTDDGDINMALYGCFLPAPVKDSFPQQRIGLRAHEDARLDMAGGFGPKTVTLTEIGGLDAIKGGSSLAIGTIEHTRASIVVQRLQKAGYRHTPEVTEKKSDIEPCSMDRLKYALAYGPTVGDSIRLGSTDLWVQASGRSDAECPDLAIVNAVVIDWTDIPKADIGVKDGVIVGIGNAGNPGTMDAVSSTMVIGSNTDIIDAKGKIVTVCGIDTHVHLICPQQASEAMASGITTMFGGGAGPSTSCQAANCSMSKTYIKQMIEACDQFPMNYGIIGKGSDSGKLGLYDQCDAGVVGLKLHEDFGCTPSTIDTCLSICEEQDIQCQIHTDSLNESGFIEHTVATFEGRTVHCTTSKAQEETTTPMRTTPNMSFTTNTVEEHRDMAATCHRLSKSNPDDVSFLDSRIRSKTMAAEDVLHDIGAISIMSSDSQAMGRCGEVIVCTRKTAHLNKPQRGALLEDKGTGADNHRVKRYISKYTINPALAQGINHAVGNMEVGKLADMVLWEPSDFGVEPCQVIKKGFIAFAQM
ncbi:hypothetical protein N7489_005054, partial [Penicillium chrysogenum]